MFGFALCVAATSPHVLHISRSVPPLLHRVPALLPFVWVEVEECTITAPTGSLAPGGKSLLFEKQAISPSLFAVRG